MSSSHSITETFTLTHSKYLASKVATDLKRFQRLYGYPSDARIAEFEQEFIELVRYDFLETVTYGYKRNGAWTAAAVRYRVVNGVVSVDDDPGKIKANLDVKDANFTSYLTKTQKWWNLTQAERDLIEAGITLKRIVGDEPGLEKGYWSDDLNYGAAGKGLSRSSVKGV
ncbi:HORMA-1 domain-containing protein [Burkholderia cepacia]|uniref:HORMA-1 domain-containing protein n=1 Tax=Burkholderia cepacia TaxID=292 RepID=UPI001CF37599|nr:hypothetical protein [Burkholderia cepacia]MCA8318604.1 hypothetical protein [Burkholderia cepacia]